MKSTYFNSLTTAYGRDITPYLRMGQISKVYYIDDENNISKTHPEYDVYMFDKQGGQTLLQNVRSANLFSSTNDYEETILEPTDQKENGKKGKPESASVPKDRQGCYVLIGFIDGDFNTPIIVGAMDHPALVPEATMEKGIHKKSVYRGLQQQINKDGEMEFTFTGVKNPDGTPAVEDQVPMTFKIGLDGTITSESGHKIIMMASAEGGDRILIQTNGNQVFQFEDTEGQESISLIQKQGSLITMNATGGVQAIASDGAYLFLNTEANEVSLVQKDGNLFSMTPDNITISHSNGTDIFSIADGVMQMTSGGSVSIQPSAFGVSAGAIEMKDQVKAGLKVENGMVALGGPAAELLDLFDQLLTQMDTLLTTMGTSVHIGNLGFPTAPPTEAPAYVAIQAQVAIIKTLLATIKGTL